MSHHGSNEDAHEIFLRWKNKKNKIEIKNNENTSPHHRPTFLNCLIELVQIVADWIIDIAIACFHFYQGRFFVGTLTLFFVFVGGLFVNFSLNMLMRRKGEREFKEELKKIHPVLLYLIHVPSFLPFFSGGMKLYFANKLRKLDPTTDKSEIERLEKLLDICDDLYVTELLYESGFEAHPQAILQIINLVEKPAYHSLFDFLPLVGVLSAWIGITMTPIKLAKSLNNVQIKWTQMVAGLANKGVTLLSFTLIIAASRNYFANPIKIDNDLVVATLVSILILSLFSEIPGLVAFHLELKLKKKSTLHRVKSDWDLLINFISVLIPITAISYWMIAMYYSNDLSKVRVIVISTVFILSFIINVIGFITYKNDLRWLGQFSMDILLLLTISFYSHFKRLEFQQIDFQYESTQEEQSVVNAPIFQFPPDTHVLESVKTEEGDEQNNNNM